LYVQRCGGEYSGAAVLPIFLPKSNFTGEESL
jgi:hypothetical protein